MPVSATSATAAASGVPVTPSVSVPVTPSVSRPTLSPPRRQLSLGGSCDSLLPLAQIWQSSGLTFAGLTRFVVGVPEPNIGRLAYLNCRYGIPPQHGTATAEPLIEIGVSLYRAAAQAQARVRGTVFDYLANNATESNRAVAGQRAVLLSNGIGPGYDVPLLVLAAGQRTLAVSVANRAARRRSAGGRWWR